MSALSQFFATGKRKAQTFLESGTFVVPPGVEVVDVLIVGGGGGGGIRYTTTRTNATSGGASSFAGISAAPGLRGESSTGNSALLGGHGGGILGGVADLTSAEPWLSNGTATTFCIGGGSGGSSGGSVSGISPGFSVYPTPSGGTTSSGGGSYGNGAYASNVGSVRHGASADPNSGAGGQCGYANSAISGCGGGGEIVIRISHPVTPGESIPVVVGAGGSGGISDILYLSNPTTGGNGGSGRVIIAWDS